MEEFAEPEAEYRSEETYEELWWDDIPEEDVRDTSMDVLCDCEDDEPEEKERCAWLTVKTAKTITGASNFFTMTCGYYNP